MTFGIEAIIVLVMIVVLWTVIFVLNSTIAITVIGNCIIVGVIIGFIALTVAIYHLLR